MDICSHLPGPPRRLNVPGRWRETRKRSGWSCGLASTLESASAAADDLSGLAVHLTARIMAESAPNSILTSRTVNDLAVGSGLDFTFLGHREMKGIPEGCDIYELAS